VSSVLRQAIHLVEERADKKGAQATAEQTVPLWQWQEIQELLSEGLIMANADFRSIRQRVDKLVKAAENAVCYLERITIALETIAKAYVLSYSLELEDRGSTKTTYKKLMDAGEVPMVDSRLMLLPGTRVRYNGGSRQYDPEVHLVDGDEGVVCDWDSEFNDAVRVRFDNYSCTVDVFCLDPIVERGDV